MNILHLFTGTIVDGTITYAVQLSSSQQSQGHTVYLCGNDLTLPTDVPFIHLPVHKRDLFQRFQNTWLLTRLIARLDLDIIHTHSRAAAWLANYACRFGRATHIYTLHAFTLDLPSHKRHNVYGKHVFSVCENIRKQAIENTEYFGKQQIPIILNGIEI